MTLQLAAFASRTGPLLADWSDSARGVVFGTNTHGFATLSCFVPMPMPEAFRWFDRPGLPWVEVSSNGATHWRGRLEDVRLLPGGIEATALGAWSVFGDLPYTDTPASPTTADAIAADIVTLVSTDNPDSLDDSTWRIDAPGVNVYDEDFLDADMRVVLTRLARLGDSQTPPRQWEVGVWEDDRLYFRPRGSAGRTWYADIADLDVERSLSAVWNSAYTRYASGASVTATTNDAFSISRYGVTRRRAISSRTTNATQATRERDAALADGALPIPRASVRVDQIFTETGAVAPLWQVRSGDTLTIRNLPPQAGQSIDRIRTFRIAETRYACDTNTLDITPESPVPSLEFLVAHSLEVPE